MSQSHPLLEVQGLTTTISARRGPLKAVDGVSFTLDAGETLGIVGESGSGKSMLCLSLIGLLPEPMARVSAGRVLFDGRDLVTMGASDKRRLRGAEIAMILQDPLASLNPAYKIGLQISETITAHRPAGEASVQRVVDLLRQVGISDPERRRNAFPHELSGGMRQRVAGAIAISCKPRLIIADEPTTALDVTVQAQYLQLLEDLQRDTGAALIVVTHDLGVVARMCRKVAVMYAGRIVEIGAVEDIFDRPAHPYTRALRDCMLTLDGPRGRMRTIEGQPPDLADLPVGCSFAARCPRADDHCRKVSPELRAVGAGHAAACWKAEVAPVRASLVRTVEAQP